MNLVDDSYDVREMLVRSRELVLALASENDELGQLLSEVRELLDALELNLEPGEDTGQSDLSLRERLVRQRGEISELRARLAIHEDEDLQRRRRLIERQHQALMTLYVATHQLLEAREPEQVHTIIFEVVVNLIGCEQAAIYAVVDHEGTPALVPDTTVGLDSDRVAPRVGFGEGLIGEVASTRELFVAEGWSGAERPEHERGISACVPLTFAERTVAVLVLYGLLEHKREGLTGLDRRVLDMLGNHAGLAMRVAGLRAQELEFGASI